MKEKAAVKANRRGLFQGIPQNVAALGLVSLLTDVSSEMIYPLLPLFLTAVLGAGAAFVGLVEGVAESTASLMKLGSGWLSDRLKKRKALVVGGYSLSTLTRPLLALAGAPWHVLVIRFLDRLGKGIRTSPRDALLADSSSPATRGKAFGFHRGMDHLGATIGPLLAFLLLPALGGSLRALFWMASIPAMGAVLILLLAVGERVPMGTDVKRLRLSLAPFDVRFKGFLAVVVLFTLGNSSDAFLLLRAKEAGIPYASIPVLWMLLHIVKAGSSMPGGILSDRWGRKGAIVVGWLIYGLAYVGFALARTPGPIWALFAFYGLFFGFTEGVEKALVADLVPQELRGTAYGVYHAAVGLAALPASLIMGLLYQAYGAAIAFAFGAALAFIAAGLLSALVPLRKLYPEA